MKKFEKTAKAVRLYDMVDGKYRSHPEHVDGELEAVVEAIQEVKVAFADDTADINDRATAMLVSPDGNNGWLRQLLVKSGHKDCGLTPKFRSSLGWGW